MSSEKTTNRGTVASMMTPGRIAVLVLGLLALIFIFENTHTVRIRLLIPQVSMPLWGALLTTFVIGCLCGLIYRRGGRRSGR